MRVPSLAPGGGRLVNLMLGRVLRSGPEESLRNVISAAEPDMRPADDFALGKNLPFATKLDRVKGLPNPTECQSATDLQLPAGHLLVPGAGSGRPGDGQWLYTDGQRKCETFDCPEASTCMRQFFDDFSRTPHEVSDPVGWRPLLLVGIGVGYGA